jgi:hypothetical protein
MQERRGLWTLGAIAVICAAAMSAWGYEHAMRTSRITRTWPAADAGEAYATIDHTAPWSAPWTKVCRIDATTHAERWCRSVPDGEHVVSVVATDAVVTITLETRTWNLGAETGANVR